MSNNRQIAKNIFYNALAFGINLIISFLLTPYLIRTVGKEAYSFFPLINNLLGYTEILTATIGSMAGRYITMAYYKGDQRETMGYFNSAIVAYMCFSAVFCIIGVFVVVFIDSLLNVPDGLTTQVRLLFAISLLGMCLNLCTYLFGVGTYVKNRLDMSSKVGLIRNAVYVLFIFTLFATFSPSIVFVSIASFVSAIVGVGYNLYFKHVLIPEIDFKPFKYFSWNKIKRLVSSGIWMSVNTLSNILTTTIDLLLTNIFISAAVTGDFSVAKTIPTFIATISGIFIGTFTANFNILYAKEKYEELTHEIHKSMKVISFIISIPIGYFMVNSDYFFQLWVSSAYTSDMVWLSFIALLQVATGYSTNTIYGIYTITDKRKIPSFALLAAGLFNIVLLFVLLKFTNLGVYAIAISSAVALGLRNLIFTPIYGAKCLNLKSTVFYKHVVKGFIGIGIVVCVGLLSRLFMNHLSWTTFVVNLVAVCCVSLMINFYFFLNKGERYYLISAIQRKFHLK